MNMRMLNMNRIWVSGRICKDLELKTTPKGTKTCSFSIANDRRYKDADSQWQTETTFINVQAWAGAAEAIVANAKKGMAVLVEGRLTCRNWTDQNGQNRQSWEIVAENIHVLEWQPKEDEAAPELPQSSNPDVPF